MYTSCTQEITHTWIRWNFSPLQSSRETGIVFKWKTKYLCDKIFLFRFSLLKTQPLLALQVFVNALISLQDGWWHAIRPKECTESRVCAEDHSPWEGVLFKNIYPPLTWTLINVSLLGIFYYINRKKGKEKMSYYECAGYQQPQVYLTKNLK